MKLEDYLSELQGYPDKDLNEKLGVSDNWPILLKADCDNLVESLLRTGKYAESKDRTNGSKCVLDYVPGTVLFQVLDYLDDPTAGGSIWKHLETRSFYARFYGISVEELAKKELNKEEREKLPEYERRLNNFNMTLLLHPYQTKRIEGMQVHRAIATVIQDLGHFFIQEGIPVCMPFSGDYETRASGDYSKIAYHQPACMSPQKPQNS